MMGVLTFFCEYFFLRLPSDKDGFGPAVETSDPLGVELDEEEHSGRGQVWSLSSSKVSRKLLRKT